MNDSRKRWLPLAMILIVGILAIVSAERHHVSAPASPQAMLDAAADAQRELTRMPAHFDPMSDADEIALGDRLAASYATELNPKTSTLAQRNHFRDTEAYLQQVGERTALHARRKMPWHFHFLPDENFVNAFALPGGHIFVGAGLLKLMRSEDALAAVLGHEVEHVDLRHCADRYQAEAHLRNLDPTGLLSLPVDIFVAGYSKQQELEADRDGTTLAVEAGYSPLGLRELLIEFGKLEHGEGTAISRSANPLDEAAHLSLATLSGYFRSHPPAEDRLRQLDSLIAANHWPTPRLTSLRFGSPGH
jgi:predicted Zn-dependent protease